MNIKVSVRDLLRVTIEDCLHPSYYVSLKFIYFIINTQILI